MFLLIKTVTFKGIFVTCWFCTYFTWGGQLCHGNILAVWCLNEVDFCSPPACPTLCLLNDQSDSAVGGANLQTLVLSSIQSMLYYCVFYYVVALLLLLFVVGGVIIYCSSIFTMVMTTHRSQLNPKMHNIHQWKNNNNDFVISNFSVAFSSSFTSGLESRCTFNLYGECYLLNVFTEHSECLHFTPILVNI